jgi:hypothetical protein
MPFLIFPDTDVKLVAKQGEDLTGAYVWVDFNGIVLKVTQLAPGHVAIDAYEPDTEPDMQQIGSTAQFKTSKLASVSPVWVGLDTSVGVAQYKEVLVEDYTEVSDGDVLKCVKDTAFFTVGAEYKVFTDSTNDIAVLDDDEDEMDLQYALADQLLEGCFVKLVGKKAENATADDTVWVPITSFEGLVVDDVLKCVSSGLAYFTKGSEYTIKKLQNSDKEPVVIDDENDDNAIGDQIQAGNFHKKVAVVADYGWEPITSHLQVKEGDTIRCDNAKGLIDFTTGETYLVKDYGGSLMVKDDDGDNRYLENFIDHHDICFSKKVTVAEAVASNASWMDLQKGQFESLKVGDVIKCISSSGYDDYFKEGKEYTLVPYDSKNKAVCITDEEGDNQAVTCFETSYTQTKWVKKMNTNAQLYVEPFTFTDKKQVAVGDTLKLIGEPPYHWYTKGKEYPVFTQNGGLKITSDDNDTILVGNLLSATHEGKWVVIKPKASKSGQVCTLENTEIGDTLLCDPDWYNYGIFSGPQKVVHLDDYVWGAEPDHPQASIGLVCSGVRWALPEMVTGENWLKHFKHA